MNSILVTGGAGYIGSHTVVELVKSGFDPIVIDNFSNSQPFIIDRIEAITKKPLRFYKGNYQDVSLLQRVFSEQNIDGVVHFAAYKSVGESVENPLKYYQNNVAGLIALLNELQKRDIKNFIFSSSCTVYGEPEKLPITEESHLKPASSPYGSTKQIGETIVRDAVLTNKKLKGIALRYFNPIGAHHSALIGELPIGTPSILVPYLTQTVAGLHDKLTVFGKDYSTPDGTCIRDYIHVVDLAKAHVQALQFLATNKAKKFDVFNIGTGTGNSVLEIINTFEKVTGQKVPYQIGKRRPGDVSATYADASKAASVLGWRAQLTLADALKDAWHWQEKL